MGNEWTSVFDAKQLNQKGYLKGAPNHRSIKIRSSVSYSAISTSGSEKKPRRCLQLKTNSTAVKMLNSVTHATTASGFVVTVGFCAYREVLLRYLNLRFLFATRTNTQPSAHSFLWGLGHQL